MVGSYKVQRRELVTKNKNKKKLFMYVLTQKNELKDINLMYMYQFTYMQCKLTDPTQM